MDRALGYGPRGCGFDSRRVHENPLKVSFGGFFISDNCLRQVTGYKLAGYRFVRQLKVENETKQKKSGFVELALSKFGIDLLSHPGAVPSALTGLTSLFGMGRGGSP